MLPRCPRFVLVTIQLGLQLQTGQDVSAVKDDVSAVKDNFDSVREGIDLYQASLTVVSEELEKPTPAAPESNKRVARVFFSSAMLLLVPSENSNVY